VRSTHTARARPTVRLLHLRLDPAHGAPAQHARTARSHNRSDQARHSSASELGCEGVGGERPRALKQTPSIRATLSPQSSATRHIVSIQRDTRPARVVALLLIARPPCASRLLSPVARLLSPLALPALPCSSCPPTWILLMPSHTLHLRGGYCGPSERGPRPRHHVSAQILHESPIRTCTGVDPRPSRARNMD
jgi:hypothetical protein